MNAALSAITAAVVGVVLNLAVWFSLHTLFGTVSTPYAYGLRLFVPDVSTISVSALAIATVACIMTFYLKRGMAVTLATCGLLGGILYLVTT